MANFEGQAMIAIQKQQMAGITAAAFKTPASQIFAGSQAAMNENKRAMHQIVGNQRWTGFESAGGHKRHGPLKHVIVGRPQHGSVGGIIGDCGAKNHKKGNPPGKHNPPGGGTIDPVGGETFWDFVQSVLRGLVKFGDTVQLIIKDVGDLFISVTLPLINACRDIGRQLPPKPSGDGGVAFEHWLNEHWVIASTGIGIVLAYILGAAIH
jgi:hypothetical protein